MIVAFMCQAGEAAAPAAAGAPARASTVEQATAITARATLFMAASSVLVFDGGRESAIRPTGGRKLTADRRPPSSILPGRRAWEMSGVSAIAILSGLLSMIWLLFGSLLRRASLQIATLGETLGLEDGARARPGDPLAAAPLPVLSVVVTARDEAEAIETTVRRLLAQRYDRLEVIVVDDRSTDGTGAILDHLQAKTGPGRLTVIHNRQLPRGWIGKCHACHLGAQRARGDWILFMDGDVELVSEDLLARIA